ncbi:MAG: PilZ domain-containing protein [Deltaproteobacteria bacterium]|nr:MAG: PilZ domain-containing protein [Deltaproteobacteria bacterium]
MGDDRRRAERHAVRLRVVCSDGRDFRPATMLDASMVGALIRLPAALEPGDAVELLPLGPSGEEVFSLPATVVRCVAAPDRPGRWHVGVEFGEVDETMRAWLSERLEEADRATSAPPLDPDPAPEDPGPRPDESIPHMRIRTRIDTKADFGKL